MTDDGLRTSVVRVGVVEGGGGGGGSGASGPTTSCAVSDGTQPQMATRRKAPMMERTEYGAIVAIVAPLRLKATDYQ